MGELDKTIFQKPDTFADPLEEFRRKQHEAYLARPMSLHRCIVNGDRPEYYEHAKKLINDGEDVNRLDIYGKTPLYYAKWLVEITEPCSQCGHLNGRRVTKIPRTYPLNKDIYELIKSNRNRWWPLIWMKNKILWAVGYRQHCVDAPSHPIDDYGDNWGQILKDFNLENKEEKSE
jgi:hypothetical protein